MLKPRGGYKLTKREAVSLYCQMSASLRPILLRGLGPKWSSFGVEYSEVMVSYNKVAKAIGYSEIRRRVV